MRSDFSSAGPLIMCMDKPHLYSHNSQSQSCASTIDEYPPDYTTYPASPFENSHTSCDDSKIIEFGPIKVKTRKTPAPTLATGRRSKYETLSPEEEQKRDLRRIRNRAAAERVRINRLTVEQDLQVQIDALEDQEQNLMTNVQMLQDQKVRLQTRLLTHQQICSPMPTSDTLDNSLHPLTSNNIPTSLIYQQRSTSNFDELLFPDTVTPVQTQQNNFNNSLSSIMPSDDFDDFLMDF